MGTYGWGAGTSVNKGLFQESYRFDFYQAVRLLEVLFPERAAVGPGQDPGREVVRFRSRVDFDFPPGDLDSLTAGTGGAPPDLLVNFMGLAGALGPLPRSVSELVYRRTALHDTAFRDFLDIFNHRLVSLMYRARKKHRVALHTGSPEDNNFSRVLLSLVGLGTPGLQKRMPVRDRSVLPYAGLLSRAARSMSGLTGMLQHYFDAPMRIQPFRGSWLQLDPDQQTRLGAGGQNQVLGSNVVLGERVWDQAAGAELEIGPLGYREFLNYLPTGNSYPSLCALTRFYSGEELRFSARLTLKATEVPDLVLGQAANARLGWDARLSAAGKTGEGTSSSPRLGEAGGARLGWTTWLYQKRRTEDDSQVSVRLRTNG